MPRFERLVLAVAVLLVPTFSLAQRHLSPPVVSETTSSHGAAFYLLPFIAVLSLVAGLLRLRRQPEAVLANDVPHSLILQTLARRYQGISFLGAGGMALVYGATDNTLRRRVAIKVLRPELWGQVSAARRFLREARAIAGINHPGVVTIHEVESTPFPHFEMEFLEGESLDRAIETGPLPLLLVLRTARLVVSALAAAHAVDVIHRDIKPSNVFLCGDESVRLIDFGLAKISSATTITHSDVMMGTPGYMAPEHVKGEEATPASDLYALGVLMYRLFSGRHPFDGPFGFGLLEGDPLRPPFDGCPAELLEVLCACLAQEPRRRPTLDVVGRVLEDVLTSLSHQGPGLWEERLLTLLDDLYVLRTRLLHPLLNRLRRGARLDGETLALEGVATAGAAALRSSSTLGSDPLDGTTRASQAIDAALAHLDGPPSQEALTSAVAALTTLLDEHTIDVVLLLRERSRSLEGDLHVEALPGPGELRLRVARPSSARTDLGEVLTCLLENALQAQATRVLVQGEEDSRGSVVTLTLVDNGEGLAGREPASLFVDGISQRDGGTGVGLAFCRRVLTAMGGTIALSAGDDGGAVVTLTIPTNFR